MRDGEERPAEVIVLATGFKTHGFVAPMEVVGEGGRTLAEEWSEVPRAYLGLSVSRFPNMFLLYGPNTNGGTGSVIYTLEAGVAHVIAALRELDRRAAQKIEVRREAAEAFDRELRAALAETVWHTGCTSWYLDENGKVIYTIAGPAQHLDLSVQGADHPLRVDFGQTGIADGAYTPPYGWSFANLHAELTPQ